MKHYTDVVQNPLGQALAGASITVYLAGTLTLASLFSDDGVTATANPVVTDANGRFAFYVADGRYDLNISGLGIVTFTLKDIEIADITQANAGDSASNFGTLNATTGNFTNVSISGTLTGAFSSNSNITFTGNNTYTGTNTFSGPLVLTGTDSGNQTISGNKTFSGNNIFTGSTFPCNLANDRYVDAANTCSWTGADFGAWVNSACAALPASGGTIHLLGTATVATQITDCGKIVKLKVEQATLTLNANIQLKVDGSGIEGLGEQSAFIAPSGLSASTVPILISKSPQANIHGVYIRNIKITNQRNSQVGMIRVVQAEQSEVKFNHADCTSNYCIAFEFVDGFSGEISGNYVQHGSVHGVGFGVTAATVNVDNVTLGANNFDFAGTFAALNYPYNGANATTLDGVVLTNPSHSYSTGPVAKAGVTTLNGNTSAAATSIVVTSGATCTVNYPIWFGSPGSTEGNNIVTNISSNTLTLMFPAQLAHTSGDQVICGSVGLWINSNTVGVSIDQGHIEGAGFDLWCRQCRGLHTKGGVYSITSGEGGILSGSDGIRLDPVYNAVIQNPLIDGVTNPINATAAVGFWGTPSFNVTMDGYTPGLGGLGNTNQGIVNNTGNTVTTLMLRCIGSAPCSYNITSNSSGIRADTDINCSGPGCQVNIDSSNTRLAAAGATLTFVGSSSGTCNAHATANSSAIQSDCGIQATSYFSTNNCSVNSVSPAACGSAPAGAFVVPTTTTNYTVNTTAVTATSRIFLQPRTNTGDLPGSPTCVSVAGGSPYSISAQVAGTSFTFGLPSTTGQTCWNYWIID